MIIIPIRGEDLAPDGGDRSSFYICSISDLNANSCHLLTKLVAGGLVVHFSPVYVDNLVPNAL